MGGCYSSTNYVSWHDWPVNAVAKRTIIIKQPSDWLYFGCTCGADIFEAPSYNVD
jgi:hypothetical protein